MDVKVLGLSKVPCKLKGVFILVWTTKLAVAEVIWDKGSAVLFNSFTLFKKIKMELFMKAAWLSQQPLLS